MKYYIVDAFTNEQFKGNPACVCILDKIISGDIMQKIAGENNLSETAFVTRNGTSFDIRWFTPKTEVKLCGHATLAAAFVIKNFYDKKSETFEFNTLSGKIPVTHTNGMYNLNLPAFVPKKIDPEQNMSRAIGGMYVVEAWSFERNLLLRLEYEEAVKKVKPDNELLKELNYDIVSVTAKGDIYDIVSRCFCPKLGVLEDPVTGSAHCILIPYWFEKLHKDNIVSFQASVRGGLLYCRNLNDRIIVGGNAVLYADGNINI